MTLELPACTCSKAASKPGVPRYYTTLAARMSLYGGDILAGIVFLQEMIERTNDPFSKKHWKFRLECLKKIAFLESKVLEYKEKYNTAPKSFNDLIEKKLLKEVPSDPYGGRFFINERGRVYTTSKMVFSSKNK